MVFFTMFIHKMQICVFTDVPTIRASSVWQKFVKINKLVSWNLEVTTHVQKGKQQQ